jgi:hypothetical protein
MLLPDMKHKPRFPIRRIVRDVIIAAGVCAALVIAYLFGTFDGRESRRAMLSLPAPQQQARAHVNPPGAIAMAAVQPRASIAPAMPSWQRNAAPAPNKSGRPLIVLVIDDMGLDRKRSARAVALPPPLTLAYLPYASDLPAQTAAARAAGHELLVHVPMEPDSAAENPGPRAIRASTGEGEILSELDWMLGRFDGYVGINNHMGSRLTRDPARMAVVLADVKRRGLLFLDSRTTAQSVAGDTARRLGVPMAERDVFLDAVEQPAQVRARLADLEMRARAQGHAIAIGHPKDVTLDALDHWMPQARANGFAFAPLTAVIGALPRAEVSR